MHFTWILGKYWKRNRNFEWLLPKGVAPPPQKKKKKKFGLGRNFLAGTYAILLQIKICRNLLTFWRSLGKKKCQIGSKTVFLGQEVHYNMVYIAYFTDLNLQICDYAQKQRNCRKNCKYAFDENLHGHFCPRRKAANYCHPAPTHTHTSLLWHFLQPLVHPTFSFAIESIPKCTGGGGGGGGALA